jgi:alkylation response protein AidB-like acyl-CoA dehydrogenase
MDFKLSEEQLILRQTAREFAQNEVRPLCQVLDAKPDPKDCFSWELIKKVSKLGFRTRQYLRSTEERILTYSP